MPLFNGRDIESVLAAMHPEVVWANGMEGGHVERFRATGAICVVTGQDPQTLEEFFRANAKAIGTGQN